MSQQVFLKHMEILGPNSQFVGLNSGHFPFLPKHRISLFGKLMRTRSVWKCENHIKLACPNRDSSEDGFLFREVIKVTLKTDLRKTRPTVAGCSHTKHTVVTLMPTKTSRKMYTFIYGMAERNK